ncbi:MAG: chromosomal replication initiator protein DnaA [Burkholderiales bacterium]|jgi:chromosomal replication initiator protein|nr:chromosomal replication initiator protein DnaA [Burkholderiales bacterium]
MMVPPLASDSVASLTPEAAAALWSKCRNQLSQKLNAQQFSMWIDGLVCESDETGLKLYAPNTFIQDWVRRNFGEMIGTFLNETAGAPIGVFFGTRKKTDAKKTATPHKTIGEVVNGHPLVIDPAHPPRAKEPDALPQNAAPATAPASFAARSASAKARRASHQLDPAFTFESFVDGKANQLARAAGLQVAETPTSYNPLFVYGGVGLGKTHLVQAIGNHLLKREPTAKVRYLHAETYVSDVVRAYQHKMFDAFKNDYHSLDLLLIDDIQFFRGKDRTQEEFFYLFNTLVNDKKQVVITCDTYPRQMEGIDERLKSRFAWGLVVALDPPELEMRVAILLAKAQTMNITLDEHVAFFIAKHVRSNVRELEGALKRVVAYSAFHKVDISMTTAREGLRDLLAVQNRQITVENIQKTIAEYYKIPIADMRSKKRDRSVVRPRQTAMALSKELTDLSLPEIGMRFGGRDHTTVLHAIKVIAQLRQTSPEVAHDYGFLLQVLRS